MWNISRRTLVKAALTLMVPPLTTDNAESIDQLNSKKTPLPFGSATQASLLDGDLPYKNSISKYCSRITPEYEFNWDHVEPEERIFNFDQADRLANFARDNEIEVYGHTLLWHRSIPAWAETHMLETENWQSVSRHMTAMLNRFDGVRFWNVVNEPIDPGFRQDGLRPSVFLRAFGETYIETALRSAREASSSALLLINEYSLEYDLPIERDRRYLFIKLLERLRQSGAPLDGVGLQAHLDLRKGRVSQPNITAFLKEIADLGLFIYITELDVTEANYVLPVAERDAIVADEVARYLDAALNFPDIRGLTTWGLTDRYSWLGIDSQLVEKFDREGYWRDGTSAGVNRGVPLDTQFRRKPFFEKLVGHGVATR